MEELMEPNVRPFGLRDKAGYMFGDFGNDFTFILSSMFLLKFYTDVMGVPAGVVGIMMMAARVVDAVTDVAMGQIVDRTKPTERGKFVIWIRRMCGPVAVASFLMYASWFAHMPLGFKIFWMFFTYILWGSVCYTGINIPYGSMASAISGNPSDRAQLSNWRTIGASLAGTVIGVVMPLVVYYQDENGNNVLSGTRMMIAALVCSIGAVICYLICYAMTTERVKVEQTTSQFRVSELLSGIVHNRALIGIIVSSICMILAQMTLTNMTTYLFPNFYGNIRAQSLSGLAGTVITLICASFTVPLSAKLGRKELGIAAALFGAAVLFLTNFLKLQNAYVFVVFYTFAYVGIAIFSLITWAMITDVIDDAQVHDGRRSDGTIYSVYSFARKVGQAASSGVTGLLLSIIGYSQATAFEPSVVNGIYHITCLAPAVGFVLLALSLAFLYPLDRKKVQENARILVEKENEAK